MKATRIVFLVILAVLASGCNKTFVRGRVAKDIHYYKHTYDATPNECYYALRWALKINGYPLAKENLTDGILTTTWEPVTSDSHYVELFDRRDYGTTGAYHQLEVRVVPQGRHTMVKVGSRWKSIVINLKSSGVEERKILAQVGNYLRAKEPSITNEGMSE